MGIYRKKPVEIEAFQFKEINSTDTVAYPQWFMNAIIEGTVKQDEQGIGFIITTLEGNHLASPGDYIIKGVKGELYPCKSDIFELTYDKVNEE